MRDVGLMLPELKELNRSLWQNAQSFNAQSFYVTIHLS
jgi:hypothetical protein